MAIWQTVVQMPPPSGVAQLDVVQTWLGERRDCTTWCLVKASCRKHRKTRCLVDATCKPHCKTRCLASILAGSILDLGIWWMGPDGNIAKRQAGICGLQQPFGKSFLHACAPPANNSKPGQQAGRSTTSEAKEAIGHAANPEQPKSWQTAMFYGLQTTLHSAVFGKCSSRETLQNKLFGGCCLQKTCRNIVLGECGLQGGIAKPKVSPRTA